MDIRLGKFRALRKHNLLLSLFRAEGTVPRLVEKILPSFGWIYGFRRRFATVAVLVITAWLFVHVTFGANGMIVYRQKREQVSVLKKEIDSLQTENELYGRQIEDLKTNPKTIEKAAREQLHYARPGEVVYVSPPVAIQHTPQTDFAEK